MILSIAAMSLGLVASIMLWAVWAEAQTAFAVAFALGLSAWTLAWGWIFLQHIGKLRAQAKHEAARAEIIGSEAEVAMWEAVQRAMNTGADPLDVLRIRFGLSKDDIALLELRWNLDIDRNLDIGSVGDGPDIHVYNAQKQKALEKVQAFIHRAWGMGEDERGDAEGAKRKHWCKRSAGQDTRERQEYDAIMSFLCDRSVSIIVNRGQGSTGQWNDGTMDEAMSSAKRYWSQYVNRCPDVVGQLVPASPAQAARVRSET